LIVGIVELAERVSELHTRHEELKTFDESRIVGLALGERRELKWIVDDEGRLHERGLDEFAEELIHGLPPSCLRLDFELVSLQQSRQPFWRRRRRVEDIDFRGLENRLAHGVLRPGP